MPDITHQLISAARAQSGKDGTRLIDVLQQMSGLENAAFVEQLAAQFHYPALEHGAVAHDAAIFRGGELSGGGQARMHGGTG